MKKTRFKIRNIIPANPGWNILGKVVSKDGVVLDFFPKPIIGWAVVQESDRIEVYPLLSSGVDRSASYIERPDGTVDFGCITVNNRDELFALLGKEDWMKG